MTLTNLMIGKMKKKAKRYEIVDGDGLYIRVTPTGNKSWIYRYFLDGNARRLTIGSYPAYSLAEAREKAAQAEQDVKKGIDPGLKKKEEKARRKTAPTFADLLDEFWEMELQFAPSGKERKRLVEKDVLKGWGKRKVRIITRRDAVLLLDRVRRRAPITANRVQGVLVRMFNFASERGIIEFSPLTGMRRGKETSRSRVLTDAEIKALWNSLDLERTDIDIYRLTKLALKVILLTGQRPGEVTGMTWAEIKGDVWTIPEERTKNGEENRIPICPMLAEVIEQAKVYSGDSLYVFRSSYKGSAPVTVRALANAIRRHSMEMGIDERFTPHDLRRTLRTRFAEIGISDIVAERVLGHKLQGVLGIYNRHGYDTEKRQALTLWEKRLREILGIKEPVKDNVIKLAEVRRNG